MISPRFIDVLRKLSGQLEDQGVVWAVGGSLGLALRGASVDPRDIDIITDRVGAYHIERIFSDAVISPVSLKTSNKIQSHFGALNIDDVKVEIMGDFQIRLEDGTWQPPPDFTRLKQLVLLEGMSIPVLSLIWEYDSYSKLGRTDRAESVMAIIGRQAVMERLL